MTFGFGPNRLSGGNSAANNYRLSFRLRNSILRLRSASGALACGIALLFLGAGGTCPGSQTAVRTTLYVGSHFQVRDHEQPTKYVFNGSTRVASIVGSLSGNARVQRLRLYAGWNLVSLAVSANDLVGQLGRNGPTFVSAVYRWAPGTGAYVSVICCRLISERTSGEIDIVLILAS